TKVSLHIFGLADFSSLQVRKRFAELFLQERDVAQVQVGARIVRRLLESQEEFLLRGSKLVHHPIRNPQRIVDAQGVRLLPQRNLKFPNGRFIVSFLNIEPAHKGVVLKRIRVELPEPLDGPERSVHVQSGQFVKYIRVVRVLGDDLIELVNGIVRKALRLEDQSEIVPGGWMRRGRLQLFVETCKRIVEIAL